MNRFLLTVLSISIAAFSVQAEEVLRGRAADKVINGTETIRYKDFSSIPAYVKFRPESRIAYADWQLWMKRHFFAEQPHMDFELIGQENDKLGMVHYRYRQTAGGYPLTFGIWIVHTLNGEVVSMNGELFDEVAKFSASIAAPDALEQALGHIGASVYKWQLPEEEALLKFETGDPHATYYPHGALEIINTDPALREVDLHLAWKFNVYASEPLSRREIYIDAMNGNVIFENDLIHHADSNGTANTGYSGMQDIVADYTGTQFRLRESGRGNGVQTFNMLNGTSYGNAVDFTDNDNFWNSTTVSQYATDAHWGAEMTYDYYWNHFNRNSINDNGFTLRSYVHYGNNFGNAFWDGQRMTYGDGSNGNSPFTTLDIAGHEVTHGLTTFTANLVYSYESGALNESFSDIFGAAIEFDALGFANGDWLIGEDLGFVIRSMSNPNSGNDPDTYHGTFWYFGPNDNGGVHTNSGVQNFWFYLLTNGGSGTNDNNDAYNVTGIGVADAGAIAYRNLVTYLTTSSQYADARFYAIESAMDLFGPCSQEVTSTGMAWYAVGVGSIYQPVVNADFEAEITEYCQAPFTVAFNNYSSNATNFLWNFGDGNISTQPNPSHTYAANGSYTVTLQASSTCGNDTKVATNYIYIGPNVDCEVILPENGQAPTQTACTGVIYDNGGPTSNYSGNSDAYVTITPQMGDGLTIYFTNFSVEDGGGTFCIYDFVEVYDGPDLSAPLIGKYCNSNLPPDSIVSSGPSLTIRMYADQFLEFSGFRIDWSCHLPTAPPEADFSTSAEASCSGNVQFEDLSTNSPSAWLWSFGDGNTDTVQHPVHTYMQSGQYTVSLVATNMIGSDTVFKVDHIQVDIPDAPVVETAQFCPNEPAVFGAVASGEVRWFDQAFATTPIHVGDSFTTAPLAGNSTFYAENAVIGAVNSVGSPNNLIGNGSYQASVQGLVFDAGSDIILESVRVYSNANGARHFVLLDANADTVAQRIDTVPIGSAVVDLNFEVLAGTDYTLTMGGNNMIFLYRNTTGVSYPYEVGGLVSIERSTSAFNSLDEYNYFYDWKVKEYCISERIEVYASTGICLGVDELNGADAYTLYPNPTDGHFSISWEGAVAPDEIAVYNMHSQLVYSTAPAANTSQTSVDLSAVARGVYLVHIVSEGAVSVKQITLN